MICSYVGPDKIKVLQFTWGLDSFWIKLMELWGLEPPSSSMYYVKYSNYTFVKILWVSRACESKFSWDGPLNNIWPIFVYAFAALSRRMINWTFFASLTCVFSLAFRYAKKKCCLRVAVAIVQIVTKNSYSPHFNS